MIEPWNTGRLVTAGIGLFIIMSGLGARLVSLHLTPSEIRNPIEEVRRYARTREVLQPST